MFELLRFSCHFDSKFLDVEGQLFDLSLICTAILLESKVILFFLTSGESPLFELLLVPVHLELELIHLLICLEDHVLNVVETILLVGNPLLKLLNLVAKPSALPLSHLLQVLLRFNLFVLNINEALSVHQLHLHRLQVLVQDLEALLVLFDLQAQLSHQSDFLSDLQKTVRN